MYPLVDIPRLGAEHHRESLTGKLDVGIVSCPELLARSVGHGRRLRGGLNELLDATR